MSAELEEALQAVLADELARANVSAAICYQLHSAPREVRCSETDDGGERECANCSNERERQP